MIKRKRLMFFIGAVLLTLAITLGLFAYGRMTATVTLGVTQEDDFVTVTAGTGPTWIAFGSYTGRIPPGDLFTIDPATGWTGDLSVILRIANAEDLIECYGILVFKIEIYDSTSTTPVKVGTTEYLSLGKGGQIYIDFEQTGHIAPYTVKVMGGNYVTHHGGWTLGREDPTIYCQVLQRSAP